MDCPGGLAPVGEDPGLALVILTPIALDQSLLSKNIEFNNKRLGVKVMSKCDYKSIKIFSKITSKQDIRVFPILYKFV